MIVVAFAMEFFLVMQGLCVVGLVGSEVLMESILDANTSLLHLRTDVRIRCSLLIMCFGEGWRICKRFVVRVLFGSRKMSTR